MLGMGLYLSQDVRQELVQRLSVEQRLAVKEEQLELRLALIEAVRGEHFEPRASCPKCFRGFTLLEIMSGFRDDPADRTTCCPECGYRFEPRLHHRTRSGEIMVAFLCPVQTLAQLPDLVDLPLDEFRVREAAVYHSAVVHFGGLRQAFAEIGLTYTHEADLEWRKQVEPFLGKLPDTVIAQFVGAPVRSVRQLRRERDIPAYSRRRAAEEIKERLNEEADE